MSGRVVRVHRYVDVTRVLQQRRLQACRGCPGQFVFGDRVVIKQTHVIIIGPSKVIFFGMPDDKVRVQPDVQGYAFGVNEVGSLLITR